MFISKYVKLIRYEKDSIILHNLYNGAIYLLPTEDFNSIVERMASGNTLEGNEHINDLLQQKFIVEEENIPSLCQTIDKFLVTIETTNRCNLNCRYCYENDQQTRSDISEDIISKTLKYIRNVFIADSNMKKVHIGFIGGEPLLRSDIVLFMCKEIQLLCNEENREVHFHIDTNGSIPFHEIYEDIDHLHISITLTNRADHNKNRPGKGFDSFERISSNLRAVHPKEHNTLSLRYNTNDENIGQFNNFVLYVKKQFPIVSAIEPMYTDEYYYNQFKNNLRLQDFRQWNSTEAIDTLIENGYTIGYSLGGVLSHCIAYQKHSCKIYSDGIVTLCDAMFHNASKLHIDEIYSNVWNLEHFFSDYKRYNPMDDPKCSQCKEVAICTGQLFCRSQPCEYNKKMINELFLKTYIKYFMQGKQSYFINM